MVTRVKPNRKTLAPRLFPGPDTYAEKTAVRKMAQRANTAHVIQLGAKLWKL
ncbi:hypothetical protein DBT_0974 [Dissulfuribacter thermophilus]|uniref:Uncharacterized protein n=1 Tax=Dissulfuribacter thermophilus TaxID=1156395 RepID=A0A1B9F6W5_9BACT|nr:hypothetical protein DBT_0974 [Dissulfuribacter thermophilus]